MTDYFHAAVQLTMEAKERCSMTNGIDIMCLVYKRR